jgi:hypothetical protein
MILGNSRPVFRYAAYVLLAVGGVVGLYYSHRYVYRWGALAAGRPLGLAYIQRDEEADGLHLYYNVLAMRVYARYPDTGSVGDQLDVCARAKIQVKMVEERVIPRLRKEGRTDQADQLTERVREARDLIDTVEKKRKDHGK